MVTGRFARCFLGIIRAPIYIFGALIEFLEEDFNEIINQKVN